MTHTGKTSVDDNDIIHCRVFREQFTAIQMVKKFSAFMESDDSSPCSQKPTIGSYPDTRVLYLITMLFTPLC
jgi:hypothetical protein